MPVPRKMYGPKQRVPNRLMRALEGARKSATMEQASFGFPGDTVTHGHHMEAKATEHPDTYIKERTRLYRESWIIHPLDDVIAWAKGDA